MAGMALDVGEWGPPTSSETTERLGWGILGTGKIAKTFAKAVLGSQTGQLIGVGSRAAETAVSLLQPYAPHVTEELWELLGHERLWAQPWPRPDETLLVKDEVEVVVQVNGKLRDRLHVPVGTREDELVRLALASERVQTHLNGAEPRKTIVVPDKLVSLVV